MTLYTLVVFDTIVAFVISLVALLTSLYEMWREEHLLNHSVLQRVHLSNLVRCSLHFSVSEEYLVGPSMSDCLSVCCILHHNDTTVTLNLIVTTMTLDWTVAFVILLVALLTSLLVMWCKNTSGNLVCTYPILLLYCWQSYLLAKLSTITIDGTATYLQMFCIVTIPCSMITILLYGKKKYTHRI
jgi:hypothetical protein